MSPAHDFAGNLRCNRNFDSMLFWCFHMNPFTVIFHEWTCVNMIPKISLFLVIIKIGYI